MALSALLLALLATANSDSAIAPVALDTLASPRISDSTHLLATDSTAHATGLDSIPRASQVPQAVGPIQVPTPPMGPVGPMGGFSSGPVVAGPTMMVGVDTAGSGSSGRSTLTAVGLSLLVPGWGHRYLGYTGRATPFFATALVAWVTLFGSWATSRSALSNAAEIANRHGNAHLGSDPDPDLLSAIRSYRSRRLVSGRHDSYNEAYLLSGKDPQSQFPDDEAHDWDWGSRENPANDAHIRSFENQIRLWRGTQVAMYSTAGVIALVRVVAAMDVLRLTRSAASRAGISLETRPLPGGMDATLAVNF